MESISIITVTGLGDRTQWFIETARSIQECKERNIPVKWMLGIRGDEKIPAEVATIPDLIIRLPMKTHIAYARNILLSYAQSEYLCTVDDADIIFADGLEQRFQTLQSRSELSWVGGYMVDLDSKGKILDKWEQPATVGDYQIGDLMNLWGSPDNWFVCLSHTVLMRTQEVKWIGGWKAIPQEDILLLCQLSEQGAGTIIDSIMIGYRRHNNQVSRSLEEISNRIKNSQLVFSLCKQNQ